MKKSTRVVIAVFTSLVLLGGAYASWTESFTLNARLDTYQYDLSLDGERIMGNETDIQLSAEQDSEELVFDNQSSMPVAIRALLVKRDQDLTDFSYTIKLDNKTIMSLKREEGTRDKEKYDNTVLINAKDRNVKLTIERSPDNKSYLLTVEEEIDQLEADIAEYEAWQDDCKDLQAEINSLESELKSLKSHQQANKQKETAAEGEEQPAEPAEPVVDNSAEIADVKDRLSRVESRYDKKVDERPSESLDKLNDALAECQAELARRQAVLSGDAQIKLDFTFDFVRD